MDASLKALIKLKEGYQNHLNGNDEIEDDVIENYEEKFHQAINDDLNMPSAMGVVWEVVRSVAKSPKLAELLLKFDTVLGLKIDEVPTNTKQNLPEEIAKLVEQRNTARTEKNWAESDRLRDEIQAKGYSVKDTKEGTIVQTIS